jgi:hypothetical protein
VQFSYLALPGESVEGRSVSAEAVTQEAGDTADGRNADSGQVVYAPIGQVLFQELDHLPAVDQCLELGRRA